MWELVNKAPQTVPIKFRAPAEQGNITVLIWECLQAAWRGLLARRTAQERRKFAAVEKIAASWRMYQQRKAFLLHQRYIAHAVCQFLEHHKQQQHGVFTQLCCRSRSPAAADMNAATQHCCKSSHF